MSSLFVMLESFWMEFLEHKMELFCFLSPTEGTEVVVDFKEYDIWEVKDERTSAFNDIFESWE